MQMNLISVRGDLMKKLKHFSVLALLLTLAACSGKTKDPDFHPYLDHPTQSQHAQWRTNPWQVADWAPTTSDGQAQMDAFFRAGVLQDFVDGKNPTLIVGQGFYHLSGFDKRRVITLFDQLYKVTSTPAASFELKDWHTGRIVGLYDRAGLQLQ
jgi:predicted small lipoprotein YifL